MRFVFYFSRLLVGILFIISGLIKANDPSGFGFKLEEYFEIFGTHFLVPYAVSLAIFVCVLEIVLGVSVLLNFLMKPTTWLLLILIIFFSILTGYSALFNKVTDCGCFGDAIKLTPWQSFFKDIVLLVFILILFFQKKYSSVFNNFISYIILVDALIFSITFPVFCYNFLPLIDFSNYKVGTDIPKGMKNSAPLQFEYVYSKNGEKFHYKNIMDAPYSDSTYKFDTTYIINPEAMAKLMDYKINTLDMVDITEATLSGNKLFVVMYDLSGTSTKHLKNIINLVAEFESKGIETLFITSSGEDLIQKFVKEHKLSVPFYFADGTLLKTFVRANPGLLLLENGVVKGKWHHNRLPEVVEKGE